MKTDFKLEANAVVRKLQKDPSQITRSDLVEFVASEGIQMVNFMYPAADRRLKTLNFTVNSTEYLNQILAFGERVDGSSLFPGFIAAGNSDLYVIPRLSTAFVDPFAPVPTLTLLASFFDKEGRPLDVGPEQTLRRACAEFRRSTGLDFHAMGELEYYVTAPVDQTPGFPARDQRGYHESSPFAKFNNFRARCMHLIATTGAQIKYGHNEVGNFTLDGTVFEQNEIEFLPVPAADAADHLMLAKWVIRTLAAQEGYDITFAPKISTGKAGSGLHIHFKVVDAEGNNVMTDADGTLSAEARKAIAGILTHAGALTAFGNKVPVSYFRLVPNQEAPTSICWGDRNRSVLVRVPLGWTGKTDMTSQVNPVEKGHTLQPPRKQTAELRSADCSADIYQLLAGITTAARLGLEDPDALERAKALYVDTDIHHDPEKLRSLASLPDSCAASADALEADRQAFEKAGVFHPAMIDGVLAELRAFDDRDLRRRVSRDDVRLADLVTDCHHCG